MGPVYHAFCHAGTTCDAGPIYHANWCSDICDYWLPRPQSGFKQGGQPEKAQDLRHS